MLAPHGKYGRITQNVGLIQMHLGLKNKTFSDVEFVAFVANIGSDFRLAETTQTHIIHN